MSEIDEDVMKKALDLMSVGCGCEDADEAEFSCEHFRDHYCQRAADRIYRALMEAKREERERDNWQPIETAPKDETILVSVVATPKNHSFFGRAPTTHPAYVDEYGRMCNVGTWLPDGGLDGDFWRATHWQPLPPPPAIKGASHDQA